MDEKTKILMRLCEVVGFLDGLSCVMKDKFSKAVSACADDLNAIKKSLEGADIYIVPKDAYCENAEPGA